MPNEWDQFERLDGGSATATAALPDDDFSQFQKVEDFSQFEQVAAAPGEVQQPAARPPDQTSVASVTARTTGYHGVAPDDPEYRMEGGKVDRMGYPLMTLDAFRRGEAPFVTIAGDPRIPYGTPASSPQFPGVPFRINDTGAAFQGAGLGHFDIARDSATGANAAENNREVQFDLDASAIAASPPAGASRPASSTPPLIPNLTALRQGRIESSAQMGGPVAEAISNFYEKYAHTPLVKVPVEAVQAAARLVYPNVSKELDAAAQSFPVVDKVRLGAAKSGAQTIAGLTAPENVAMLGALALAPAAGVPALVTRGISLGFSAQAATAMAQEIKAAAATTSNPEELTTHVTNAMIQGAFATLAGVHGLAPASPKNIKLPEQPRVDQNAIQEPGTGAILQRQSQETGSARGERGGVEPGQQGPQIAATSPPAAPEQASQPVAPGILPAAVQATAEHVMQAQPSKQALGATATGLTLPNAPRLVSIDPKVEARWRNARRVKTNLLQRAMDAARLIKAEFTRADPLLNPATDGIWINAVRRFRTISRHSQEVAANVIRGFTEGLNEQGFEIFQRNVILRDLQRDVAAGHYEGKDLPFGYTPETLAADVQHFGQLAARSSLISKALSNRTAFFNALKQELVANGLLPEAVLEQGDYFHRQITSFLNMQEAFTPGTGTNDVRAATKGFQRARTHSVQDYNTKYLESEYEVLAQALAQIRTVKSVQEFKAADIKQQLYKEAEDKKVEWKTLIPPDYTLWQPKEGNVFYHALSIPEKLADAVIKGEQTLEHDQLRDVIALGGKREQWVIPKRLATTLDNLGPPRETGVFGRTLSKLTSAWKVWTLLSPLRSLKYGLNNLSGDLDITFAYSPEIAARYGQKAAADMRRYVLKRGELSREINEGIEQGVLSGGFSVEEVPDVSRSQYFKAVTGENPSLIERGWQRNKDYHNWRENTLRLAAWRYFRDKLKAGDGKRYYAASRRTEMDALYDAGRPTTEIAAKLARELIGDYGNISHAGQWIRSHAIPFYSWMEVNAPRYVRILKNAAAEGEGNVADRTAILLGKKAAVKATGRLAKTAVQAAGLYALVNVWNKTFFPQDEEQLGDQRRQLHLILGHNEDGSIRTIRLQGALSDALSWAGGEDLPSDVQDVATGKASLRDKAIEAVLAPEEKLISGVTPFIKTPAEALTRRSFFPDPFNPRPIRDPWESIAQTFGLEKPYRYFTDKPTQSVMNEAAGLITYSTDPGEAAYHMARGLVAKWNEAQGGERSSSIPTHRQNALFYYKKAIQLGEHDKAERWKARYEAMGGSEKGITQSIKAAAPLGSLSARRQEDFLESLSPKEKEIVARAQAWYEKVYDQ